MSGPFGSSQWMYSSGFYPYAIDQSLRFNDDDSAYLTRTPSSAGNRKTWTWSGWVKRGDIDTGYSTFWSAGVNLAPRTEYGFQADNLYLGLNPTGSSWQYVRTDAVFRDHSAWYHIVFAIDMTQATSTDRVKCWVNGVAQTFSSYSVPAQNTDLPFNNNVAHYVGSYLSGAQPFDGYLAEVNFIDGTALDASSFGETKSGIWIPKAYSGSYGSNGFYLPFEEGSGGLYEQDRSGNGNNFVAVNMLQANDVVLDSPTNNFAVLNALEAEETVNGSATLSEGNLKGSWGTSEAGALRSTIGVSSGKWYAEAYITGTGAREAVGVVEDAATLDQYVGHDADGYGYFSVNGEKYNNGSSASYGATYGNGDIIGMALDMDGGTITFYKNGVSQGTAYSSLSGTFFFAISDGNSSIAASAITNFGQDSTFAGATTAGGNSDANGVGDFKYAPPSGYLALCASNLPAPAIDPAVDDTPEDYFNTVLYTGNGTTNNVTGVGFQPDFGWFKSRSNATSHELHDVIRGTGRLFSNTTDAEATALNGFVDFASDGYSLDGTGGGGEVNTSGRTYAAWNWKAGGTAVSNTDGSITSSVSANTKAGFSIVSYTGTGSAATVGHGLSDTPTLIITKQRSSSNPWPVNSGTLFASGNMMFLDRTDGEVFGGSNALTSYSNTTFGVSAQGATGAINDSGETYIAYCFHSVEGFSKVGSYTGNGSSDGSFVFTGFRPAWVLIKKSSANGTSWQMYDNKRDIDNVVENRLIAEGSNAEGVGLDKVDFLSNGFKLRENASTTNASGATFVYLCFAEQPFKYSNAR